VLPTEMRMETAADAARDAARADQRLLQVHLPLLSTVRLFQHIGPFLIDGLPSLQGLRFLCPLFRRPRFENLLCLGKRQPRLG
jgi:hypothetical protein